MQIVCSSRRGSRKIDHVGSAHTPEEVEALKAAAVQRLARRAALGPASLVYRTVQIRVGKHTVTAEDPLPEDLRDALAQIN